MAGINDFLSMMNAMMDISSKAPTAGVPEELKKNIPKTEEDLTSIASALRVAKDLEKFQSSNPKNFEDITGPVMGRVAGTPLMDILAAISPKYNTSKMASQKILEMMNPYRKSITGAQASYQELAKMIGPMFPQLTDTASNFAVNNRNFQFGAYRSLKDKLDQLGQMGIDYSKYLSPEIISFVKKIDEMPEETRNLYFGQNPQTVNDPADLFQASFRR